MSEVIERALSYFQNGNVPTVKTFADEAWRPNRIDMDYNERLVTDYLMAYAVCYERIKRHSFESQLFEIYYSKLKTNKSDVSDIIEIPFNIDALDGMIKESKIEKARKIKIREAERTKNTRDAVLEVASDLGALNARRSHIMELINKLEADTQAVAEKMKGEGLGIHVGSLYAPDGVFTITDKNPQFTWDHKNYTFNIYSGDMTPIIEKDCDCDCDCDDCN